jgi:ketosteroid isomerase-like protein
MQHEMNGIEGFYRTTGHTRTTAFPRRIKQGDQLMSRHVTISPEEAADRLAIRELVEAYAHSADRRDATGQMALFTPDTHFVVYMNAKDSMPSQELHSREELAPVFADLNKYDATTHFVGQSTIFTLTSDRATGEAYCLAHHVMAGDGKRRLMVTSLRYLDTFVQIDRSWLFAERRLYVDWLEERALS